MADTAEIPNLKRKEKERKKAGVVWGNARPLGTPFEGALGGNVAAASAAIRGIAGAEGVSGAGGFGVWLARLGSTLAGKLILAGAATLLVGGGIYIGSHFWGLASSAGETGPILGGLSSNMRIRGPRDSAALKYAANAGKGQLKFEEPGAAGQSPETQRGGEIASAGATDASGLGKVEVPPGSGLAAAKLTSALGAEFGGKNIFNNPTTHRFGQGFDRSGLSSLGRGAERGSLKGSFAKQTRSSRFQNSRIRRGSAGRAMGQLKLARGLSIAGANSGSGETPKTLASDAFDQRLTNGGSPPPGPTIPENPVVPPGSGAPDVTMPDAPIPPFRNMTPYQRQLDTAKDLIKQAAEMKKQGMMLMIIGAVLMLAGLALLRNPTTAMIGAILLGIGGMLLGMGIMLIMMAGQLANQAKQMSEQIKSQYGQIEQGQNIDACADQALASGSTANEACQRPTHPGSLESNSQSSQSVKRAVETERNQTYQFDNGAPVDEGAQKR
jgi:hypothetical protein